MVSGSIGLIVNETLMVTEIGALPEKAVKRKTAVDSDAVFGIPKIAPSAANVRPLGSLPDSILELQGH
jgi:hypothetical protein